METQDQVNPDVQPKTLFPEGFVAVDSSAFLAARFVDGNPTGTMEVIFHPKKDQVACPSWSYEGVTRAIFDDIMGAKASGNSIGSFFARIIKKNPVDYPGHPLPNFVPTVEQEG